MKLKHYLKIAVLSSSVAMSTGSVHAGGLDFLEPSKISGTIKNIIAKQSIGANINIVDAQIYESLAAALNYKLASEPSYVDGYYTRLDKYTLDVDANPGDFIDGNDLPIGFSIDSNTEITFARQFKKQSDSITALPYGPKNLPLSARQAINNLKPGDFVAFTGKLSLIVSLEGKAPISSLLTASGSTHALISGEFLIHTFRMNDNKLRVKLIAVRGKGADANSSLDINSFKVIGLKYADQKMQKWIHTDLINIGVNINSSYLFMLDYVFDLNNPQAALAYDDLIQRKTRFKPLAFANPLSSNAGARDELLTDLSNVEEIANADRGLNTNQRRIDRVFKGSNDSEGVNSSFKFGLNLLRLEAGSTYAQNKVVHFDRDEKQQKYILDSFQTSKNTKAIFGLMGEERSVFTNLLFQADDTWTVNSFVALTAGRAIKMTNVSQADYQEVQNHVKAVIPASEYAKIDWKKWDFSNGDRVNGYFKNEIFFHPNSLASISKLDYSTAYGLLRSFVGTHGEPKFSPQIINHSEYDTVGLDRYNFDLQAVAKAIIIVFDPAQPANLRYNSFKQLKSSLLWQQYGGGFLLSLIPPERLSSVISYEMTFSAKDVETISYRFGNFKQEELYKSLMYIQNVISNRSFDLRLYTNEKGEFKAMQ